MNANFLGGSLQREINKEKNKFHLKLLKQGHSYYNKKSLLMVIFQLTACEVV